MQVSPNHTNQWDKLSLWSRRILGCFWFRLGLKRRPSRKHNDHLKRSGTNQALEAQWQIQLRYFSNVSSLRISPAPKAIFVHISALFQAPLWLKFWNRSRVFLLLRLKKETKKKSGMKYFPKKLRSLSALSLDHCWCPGSLRRQFIPVYFSWNSLADTQVNRS